MNEHIDRLTLDAYIEQALSAAERRSVEAHMTACSICQARLAAAKQMPALLYQIPREAPASTLTARINAAVAAQRAQRAPALVRWTRALVPAMFILGIVLLVLSIPQWSGLAGMAAAAQLPNDQAILSWLGNFAADPSFALDAVMTFAEQTLTGAAEDLGVWVILATVLLAAASLAGLAQLLGGERPVPTA